MAPKKDIFVDKKVIITFHKAEFAPAKRSLLTHIRN